MLRKKVNVNNIDSGVPIKIGLCVSNNTIGQQDIIERDWLEAKCEESVNEIVDHDKVKYIPKYKGQEVDSIKFSLKKNNVDNPLLFADLGLTQNDIDFNYDRFLNSFMRVQFYDSPINTKANLVDENIYFVNTENVTSVNDPVEFISENPKSIGSTQFENYCLFWYKDANPSSLYMTVSYANAVDGIETQYFSYPNVPVLNQVESLRYIEVQFDNTDYSYEIVDTGNNIIQYDSLSGELEICLLEVKSQ